MERAVLDLSGTWHLSETGGGNAISCTLPGDGITALHLSGLVPDPYWGRNEQALRWIGERDWVMSRDFSHDGGPADLVIDGLDTVAEVRVNGAAVLNAANAFRRWRVPVSDVLRPGLNRIEIIFHSPVAEARALAAAQPFPIPHHAGNCPIPHGNMLRKPQCDFGWDWNIALPTFGVWGAIRLELGKTCLGDVFISQRHFDGLAEVTVRVRSSAQEAAIGLCGLAVTVPVQDGVATARLRISDPTLWWPAGQGAQVLHPLTITSGGETVRRQIGLRDLRLISQPDAAGRGFAFHVNGRPVFARGANWVPADALHGRITRENVRDLLQSAVDAQMNMIRVWGGGRYEPDWFYDLCDELGLMVWQDFMFACHLYPSTPEFLAEVAAEVDDVVGRINHHACLALWCGDNELIGALGWFDESRKDRDRYLVNYDRLNRTIETRLLSLLPDANWWPSSPSPGPMSFGDAWHDDAAGDMHFWSVWHEGREFDHYRDVRPRFCSEFGFQSYPSLSVIEGFAAPENWNIAAPVMESHQKNAGGNARIAETMFRYFRFPVDFAQFVYLSQVQQGLAIKTAVDAWRGIKPQCMGTLYWQLNDTWPVCSWSSLDHGGNWKLLHHMAQRFFAPVSVMVVPDATGFDLRAVNDMPLPARITVKAFAARMDGGLRPLGEVGAVLGTETAHSLLRIPRVSLADDEVIWLSWSGDAQDTDVHAPNPWKSYDLRPAGLRLSQGRVGDAVELILTAEALAPFVAVEADVPGRFSANAITLVPGHQQRILFTPRQPGAAPRFTLRDLHSATYGPAPGRATHP